MPRSPAQRAADAKGARRRRWFTRRWSTTRSGKRRLDHPIVGRVFIYQRIKGWAWRIATVPSSCSFASQRDAMLDAFATVELLVEVGDDEDWRALLKGDTHGAF